jgi:hypothetical protein
MLGGEGGPDGACHREGVGLTRGKRLLKKDTYCACAEALREGLKGDAEGLATLKTTDWQDHTCRAIAC